MTSSSTQPPLLDQDELESIERLALELARLAGQRIEKALVTGFEVEYKTEAKDGSSAPTDPVSEVDRDVEAFIRERVAEHFPAHAILGEEVTDQPDNDADFAWVLDPVDGTSNFVNRFPLFSSSIGVLYRGYPVVGAVWCSTGHLIRPGVYHAHAGGPLMFEDEPVDLTDRNDGVRRKLSAAPGGSPGRVSAWDNRVTGSAAIECAFAAAGIFTSGQFWGPSIWDVAGGVVLLQAASRTVVTRGGGGWVSFERFEPPATVKADRDPTLRDWRRPLLVGSEESVEYLKANTRRRSFIQRVLRR